MKKFLAVEHHDDMVTNGETRLELEKIIWAKMSDTSQLSNAQCAEKQKQVSIKVDKKEGNFISGIVRIRETIDSEDQANYVLTIKQEHGTDKGKTETELPATRDAFVQLAGLSDQMVTKHRYCFSVADTDLMWEVDAAPDGKGGYHEWVRIELEIPTADMQLPSLPFDTDEVIFRDTDNPEGLNEADWGDRNHELFDTYFVQHGPLVDYVQKEEEVDPNSVAATSEEESTDETEVETTDAEESTEATDSDESTDTDATDTEPEDDSEVEEE